MKILILGDFVPTSINYDLCSESNLQALFGKTMINVMNEHDYTLFNLEAPIYDGNKKIEKCGPNLQIPIKCAEVIKHFKNPIACLANNHIFDSGLEGLISTLNFLDINKISHCGAGLNFDDLKKPLIINDICIFNYCEHEFSFDEKSECGANQFEEGRPYLEITKIAKKGFFVIVVFHGGKEHFMFPSKKMREKCRNIIDCGAKFVFCQHSHCIGAIEKYNGGVIFFGQGNFLFRKQKETNMWSHSIAVSVDTRSNCYEIIPFKSYKNGIIIDENKKATIDSIPIIESSNKKQIEYIDCEYNKFAKNNFLKYLCKLRGYSKIRMGIEIYILHGLTLKLLYSKKKLKTIENIINCESHNELLVTGLRNFKK